MNHDTSDPAQPPDQPAPTALPQEPSPRNLRGQDVDPASIAVAEDDDEARLPEQDDESAEFAGEATLAVGRAAIERAVKLAPTSPGVYRMLNAANDVLYVGKAKSVKKRLASYARPTGQVARIARMIAATVNVEMVSRRPRPKRCCWKPTSSSSFVRASTCSCATTSRFPIF